MDDILALSGDITALSGGDSGGGNGCRLLGSEFLHPVLLTFSGF